MENYTPESGAPNSDKDKINDSKAIKADKAEAKSILSSLDQKTEKVVEKISESSLLQRLTGEAAKPEAGKSTTKPGAAENTPGEQPAESTEQAHSPAETSTAADPEITMIEVPLHDVRDKAEDYVDLRHDAVQQELHDEVTPEAIADDMLLQHAAEGLATAEDDSSFRQVIDQAYDQAESVLHDQAAEAPDVAAAASVPSMEYSAPAPTKYAAEQAYRAAEASAGGSTETVHSPRVEVAPAAASEPADTRVRVPWMYRRGPHGENWLPAPWPPKQPERSLLDKVSDTVRLRQRRREAATASEQKIDQQTEAIQRYIDTKESAIRTEATKLQTSIAEAAPVAVTASTSAMERPAPATAPQPEQPAEQFTSRSIETTSRPPAAQPLAERVQRMDHAELLATAEKIIVNGTSVREIYEAKSISEAGLQRITTEYLRGGDVKHALDQELLLKQMTYERDPQLRNDLLNGSADAPAKGSSHAADVPAAAAKQADDQQSKPSVDNQSSTKKLAAKHNDNPAGQVLIRAWIVLVILLAFVALVLLLR